MVDVEPAVRPVCAEYGFRVGATGAGVVFMFDQIANGSDMEDAHLSAMWAMAAAYPSL